VQGAILNPELISQPPPQVEELGLWCQAFEAVLLAPKH
jgi:hypothetical protein